jgi:hypothetical protein
MHKLNKFLRDQWLSIIIFPDKTTAKMGGENAIY